LITYQVELGKDLRRHLIKYIWGYSMPVELKEIMKFIKDFGYNVKVEATGKSVVDELLGAFEGAIPEGTTSTEYLKMLRETGYGKY